MIAFSHSLNLSVVCEGVETVAHDEFISATECDVIQGWYYSGVMPMRECDEFIAEYVKKLVPAEN
jgi:EAL domain-containing protein (putative c-di-GMP-specific phosphodiesterase class I)